MNITDCIVGLYKGKGIIVIKAIITIYPSENIGTEFTNESIKRFFS